MEFPDLTTSTGALLVAAVLGTIAFATSGVVAAAAAKMDLLGAVVLAVAVSIGGGTIRDILIGNLPVTWVKHSWPLVVALGTAVVGLTILRLRPGHDPTRQVWYLTTDAVGLGAFTVVGSSVALQHGTSLFIAVFMGVISGVGGGVVRDVFTGRMPILFVGQVYGSAAIIGASVFVALDHGHVVEPVKVWVPLAVVVALRALAVRYNLHLPRAGGQRQK